MVHYNSASSIGNLAMLPAGDARPDIVILAGNIEDSDFVFRAVENQEIVLHLAALIGIPYSYAAPRSYVRTNIEGTLNVLEAARRFALRRVVHTSTSEVYGTAPLRADRRRPSAARPVARIPPPRSPPTSWPKAMPVPLARRS